MEFNENLLTRIVVSENQFKKNVDLVQSNKYPLSSYPVKTTVLEALMFQAEFPKQKQIFLIML